MDDGSAPKHKKETSPFVSVCDVAGESGVGGVTSTSLICTLHRSRNRTKAATAL